MAWRGLPATEPERKPINGPRLEMPQDAIAGLCVLASGSSGNCSVLVIRGETTTRPERVVLIDAGVTPSRTRALLASRGVPLWWIDDIVLTHLDLDHFHNGWKRARDCRATLRLHRRHVGRAERQDKLLHRNEPFDDADGFALGGSTRVTSELLAHDEHGVAALRFNISSPGTESVASLGFATDLGRVTQGLVRHLGGVDVLAIESNYCPEMQRASDRPAFLKKRIMGGAGHLSNAEAADAVGRIGPRDHAVFLHMSRECNQPAKIAELHAASDYAWTIATQHEPTRWVWLKPSPSAASARPSGVVEAQPGLFEGAQAP